MSQFFFLVKIQAQPANRVLLRQQGLEVSILRGGGGGGGRKVAFLLLSDNYKDFF